MGLCLLWQPAILLYIIVMYYVVLVWRNKFASSSSSGKAVTKLFHKAVTVKNRRSYWLSISNILYSTLNVQRVIERTCLHDKLWGALLFLQVLLFVLRLPLVIDFQSPVKLLATCVQQLHVCNEALTHCIHSVYDIHNTKMNK